ncbi:MAG: bacillithiol biosynthesis BshC [Acidobacteriota bacterium]
MTAIDSSSSATRPSLDVALAERLPELPRAFLAERDRDLLAPIAFHAPPASLASPPRRNVPDRAALAAGLQAANAAYGHPRAEELARKLADPQTQVVVTGQQPGLFGGPLLVLSKAVAAARAAQALEDAGQSAVAIFWVATEDHDFAEVARATFLGREGPQRLDLGDDPSPLLPVGMRTFGEALEAVADDARELVGGDRARKRFDAALAWYRPDARFGEAFCRLLIGILDERAPLFLDSMLPEVKQAQAPSLRRLVVEREAVGDALETRHAAIASRGYALQVEPQPGTSPLFLLRGRERRRIEWRGKERFGLRGLDDFEQPVEVLLAALDENPSVVSPGVLARPAMQDAILGTTLQILGPGEMSYMPQAAAVHRQLGLTDVATMLRPQTAILDGRQVGYLNELGLSLQAVLERPPAELIAERLGDDPVESARRRIEATLCRLRQPVIDVDGSLENPWRKTRDQMHRNLDQLSSKVTSAIARRHEIWLRRLEQLGHAVAPNGKGQERELSTMVFWARYGSDLVERLWSDLDLDAAVLRPVVID